MSRLLIEPSRQRLSGRYGQTLNLHVIERSVCCYSAAAAGMTNVTIDCEKDSPIKFAVPMNGVVDIISFGSQGSEPR